MAPYDVIFRKNGIYECPHHIRAVAIKRGHPHPALRPEHPVDLIMGGFFVTNPVK